MKCKCSKRILFPYLVYDKEHSIILPKNLKNGWIYSMNVQRPSLRNRIWEGRITPKALPIVRDELKSLA